MHRCQDGCAGWPGLSLRWEGAIRGLRYGRGWADRCWACCWSQSVLSSRGVQILKYCVRISPQILTTDPHPRLRPQADAMSDPLSVCESATCFLTTSSQAQATAVCPIHVSVVHRRIFAEYVGRRAVPAHSPTRRNGSLGLDLQLHYFSIFHGE